MDILRTEGIVLQALTFKEHDRILTIFSEKEGLIKLMVKGALSRRTHFGAPTHPLTLSEFMYVKRAGEIWTCKEVSLLSSQVRLRERLDIIEAAGEIAHILLATQLLHQPTPLLYLLCKTFLEKLPHAAYPATLAASFRLKLLRHEGEFCLETLQHTYHLSEEELYSVANLAFNRSFDELSSHALTPALSQKIRQFLPSKK
jgi:DNA repair protein RecO (recombination protein O)